MNLCRTPRRRRRLLEMIGSRAARAMGCPFELTGSKLWRGPGRPLREVTYALPAHLGKQVNKNTVFTEREVQSEFKRQNGY